MDWDFFSLIYGLSVKHTGHELKGKKWESTIYSVDQQDEVSNLRYL